MKARETPADPGKAALLAHATQLARSLETERAGHAAALAEIDRLKLELRRSQDRIRQTQAELGRSQLQALAYQGLIGIGRAA